MAKSRYEYVRTFEQNDSVLKNTWLVVRLDGRGFHKLSKLHEFAKPNDKRALDLMNKCAEACIEEFSDVVIAYGESDEFSFILSKSTNLFNRRASKISTSFASCFAANYVFHWNKYMVDGDGAPVPLQYPPVFDGRVVCYPSLRNIRDYLSWRQADCHINNLYNTCFWGLVLKTGLTEAQAHDRLKGTFSNDKQEILFSEIGVNYSEEPDMFKKGSILMREKIDVTIEKEGPTSETDPTPIKRTVTRQRSMIVTTHEDLIGDKFWEKQLPRFEDPTDELFQPERSAKVSKKIRVKKT